MVKVGDIENIIYYRSSCLIQNKWRIYLSIKNKSANNIIQCWKEFKLRKSVSKIFFCIFVIKKVNRFTKKIQKIWRIKNIKLNINNENCPISLLDLNNLKWEEKILLEKNEKIYGFLLEDLFSYYISGNPVICPFTRRHLRYYEVFNILKKKFMIDTEKINTEEQLLIVNNFLLLIESIINKQEEVTNTIEILKEDLELCIESIFSYLFIGIWDSRKQLQINRIFLKTLLIGYRYNILNPGVKQNIPLTLKNDIIQKLDIYFRNYSSRYFLDSIDDRIVELLKSIFNNAIIKSFNYCNSIISNKETDGVDNIIRIITTEIGRN
tara:strand:- start:2 stop:970 length:969 start_codon:yes stop_codon:yes gene_type:complete